MLPAIEKFMLKLTEKKPKIESKKEKEYRKTRMELKRQREEELKAMKEKRKELERAKKQKKDYEDRLKIERVEAEERRKMRELEKEMEGVERDDDDDDDERLGKIPLEMEEIVKFFNHEEIYRRRGVKIPGGILLCDPPGVEKTLLAKAVAGEAGAPSVVFIDELDAVGKERGLIRGSGGQECDATLNQLLMCLDGFEGRGEVITIASTNRPDILDPALVRPGRSMLKKRPMVEDVDYFAVASMTDGMVGAELANIVEITTDGLLQAAQMEERGILDKKERSMETWKQVAINEAAMAVVAMNFSDIKNIGSQLLPELLSTIWAETADNARSVARDICSWWAFREEPWNYQDRINVWVLSLKSQVQFSHCNHIIEITHFVTFRCQDIDLEAMRIVNLCYERAKEILHENKVPMDAVVNELVEKKNITKQDFLHLVDLHGSIQPMPPNILDLRAAKQRIPTTS
ncbi:hypothetical protein Ahy_A10g048236 [Arachis hypogaea]|uniref:ATPase AAA-type core domain-containing protein n=1 Tax=Arachis hypogaea TaxID=3818 RepID=A0A445B4K8_ARAHY|nr:hypothetical protein Ahy_A10g048236 [Arachis hypogaea]